MNCEYNALVKKAKTMLKRREEIRMQVADLALEACTIKLGGQMQGFYTAKQFADDVGMSRNTLCTWIQSRRIQLELEKNNIKTTIKDVNKIRGVMERTPARGSERITRYSDIDKINAARKVTDNPNDGELQYMYKKVDAVRFFLRTHQLNEMDTEKIARIRVMLSDCLELIDNTEHRRTA